MGRYVTSTSISVLLPNWLSGNTTSSDAYGTDIWSAAADRAEGEVNAAIVARYDPSTWTSTGSPAVPPMVRKLAEDLTCYYTVRSAMTQDSQIKNPNLADWVLARDILADLRDGRTKLAYTDGSLVPTRSSSRISSSTQSYNHIFGLSNERAWGVGSSYIDDDTAERNAGGAGTGDDFNDTNP